MTEILPKTEMLNLQLPCMNSGSVLESYTVGVSNQVDEEDPDDDDDPLQDDGAVDKLKYEDIPLNTVIVIIK